MKTIIKFLFITILGFLIVKCENQTPVLSSAKNIASIIINDGDNNFTGTIISDSVINFDSIGAGKTTANIGVLEIPEKSTSNKNVGDVLNAGNETIITIKAEDNSTKSYTLSLVAAVPINNMLSGGNNMLSGGNDMLSGENNMLTQSTFSDINTSNIIAVGANISISFNGDNSAISSHGFIYSKSLSGNLTLQNQTNPSSGIIKIEGTEISSQDNSFSVSITGLSPNTPYFIRAYVINNNGTFYSFPKQFSTLEIINPTLSRHTFADLTERSAKILSDYVDGQNSPTTSYGIIYSNTQSGTDLVLGGGLSEINFTGSPSNIITTTYTGLSSNTIYYARPYFRTTYINSPVYGRQFEIQTSLTNYVTIPDDNFRNAILTCVNTGTVTLQGGRPPDDFACSGNFTQITTPVMARQRNQLPVAALESITQFRYRAKYNREVQEIELGDSEKISNLAGIQNMTNLKRIDVIANNIPIIDVSNNTALVRLRGWENNLTSLDISKNTALTYISMGQQNISSINLSQNTALESIHLDENTLTTLDVSNNTALMFLNVPNNQLTNLDLSNNTAMERLWAQSNQLTNLNVSNNTALMILSLYYNQLTNLNLTDNTALTGLWVFNNQLTNLNISSATALTTLEVYRNQLTQLNVSNNTALTLLNAGWNRFTTMDFSTNVMLTHLRVQANQLNNVTLPASSALINLNLGDNNLSSVDVSAAMSLEWLGVADNQLRQLDVSNQTALGGLLLENNDLISLDISNSISLNQLYISGNQNLSCILISGSQMIGDLRKDNHQMLSESCR